MLQPIERFRSFLGEGRFWMLIGLLITTGIASFVLVFIGAEQAIAAQTFLALGFFISTIALVGSRLSAEQRGKWVAILVPAFGLVMLGMLFFPQYQVAFLGGAVGWTIVGLFIFGRNQAPMQYRQAVKAMRQHDYKAAVAAMDDLIKDEPDVANHYRFRAELLRLWGKLGRARRNYEEMLKYSRTDAERTMAYNGLSEVELQSRHYEAALQAAQAAHDLAPDEWVTAYNLGMIHDRLGNHQAVIDSLHKALADRIPDSRHRLLVYLWLGRAQAHLGQLEAAEESLAKMRRETAGLKEWQKILPDAQAAVLREVLEADVHQAEKWLKGDDSAAQLVGEAIR